MVEVAERKEQAMPEMEGTPTETSDLAGAISQAQSSLLTKPEEAEETPETTVVEPEVQPDSDDSPLGEVDPSTLPPELQAVYKNLMKGFTQGRQKDREEVNALKAQLEELQGKFAKTPEEPTAPVDPVEAKVQEVLAQRESKSFVDKVQKEYPTIDPRLNRNDTETYNEEFDYYVGAKLDQALDAHLAEGKPIQEFDYQAEAKTVIAAFDAFVNKQIEQRLQETQAKAQAQLSRAKRLNPETSTVPVQTNAKMDLSQAISMAMAKKK